MNKKNFSSIYSSISVAFLNAVILIITVNMLLLIYQDIRYSWIKDIVKPYFKKEEARNLLKSYEGIYTLKEIYGIRNELYLTVQRFMYDPWTLFRERPFDGKYTHVSKSGYRLNGEGSEGEGKPTIFVFGGSTMFGYGVADGHTIASFLEKELPGSRVYNYGRAYYYSSQELQLFLKLLKEGNVPDIAIFLDGINDTRFLANADEPALSDIFRAMLDNGYFFNSIRFPILSLIESLVQSVRSRRTSLSIAYQPPAEETATRVISAYKVNTDIIRLIASRYNVKTYFFWQPAPQYAYDLRNHLFKDKDVQFRPEDRLRKIYEATYRLMDEKRLSNIIWLGDIFKEKEYVYIDSLHYNPVSCKMIAQRIADVVRLDARIETNSGN